MILKVPCNQVHRACAHNAGGRPHGRCSARTALPNCRVLIVEDEYCLAQDLTAALQSRGAKVVVLVGALGEALEQFARGCFDGAAMPASSVEVAGLFTSRQKMEPHRL